MATNLNLPSSNTKAEEASSLAQELELLRAQNAKLKKINQALIERVEAAGSASPYAAFQHAATLSEQVRERTSLQQQALAQKSLLLQHTVDNLAQGVALADPSGVFQLWNQQFSQLASLSDEQLALPMSAEQLLTQSAIASLCLPVGTAADVVANAAVTGAIVDGKVLTLARYLLSDGSTLFTLTDVSEQHKYTETLRASERWIRTITDHIPAMIAYLDADLCFRFTNQGYDDFYGVERGALLGKPISAVHQASALAQLQPHFQRVLSGQSTVFEIDENNSSGETRCLLKSYVPNLASHLLTDPTQHTQPLGFFVLIRDITERKQSSAALQQANLMLEQRVLERTQALSELNQQLLAAKKAAELANQSKSQFLAAISHDLLQPLNAARLFNATLAEQTILEKSRKLVDSTARSLENVAQLLATLVDMSRLEAGVQPVELTEFSLGKLLQDLVAEAQPQAEQAQITLRLVATTLWVQSDATLLSRILRNLLSNAIRYTPAGGKILVGVRRVMAEQQDRQVTDQMAKTAMQRAQSRVAVQVLDTGIGIAATDQAIIFQEFKRLARFTSKIDDSPSKNAAGAMNDLANDGLGLGLAIVQKTAALLGHSVTLHSQLHKGSVFGIELPRAQPASSVLANLSAAHLPKLCQEQQLLQPLAGCQIWVVDNDLAIILAMQALLSQWGCVVTTAQSEDELLSNTKDNVSPDLLIVDQQLADGKTGTELAKALQPRITLSNPGKRQNAKTPPVLVISAENSAELRAELAALQFHFLPKPVAPVKLKALIMNLLLPINAALD